MRRKVLTITCLAGAVGAISLALMTLGCSQQTAPPAPQQPATPSVVLPPWGPQHDRNAPQPPVVDPGTASTQAEAGKPPSDAIVLFNGKDLSNWESEKGGPAEWKVEKGDFATVPGKGDIRTKQAFGDCQLHVEWSTPNPPHGEDQDRGNSGVYLQSNFEIQVLDSYQSKTYPDGQAAALYGQYIPLVNACRPPGQWQTYDIVFHGPRFDAAGKLTRAATVTVIHNGVLAQDHVTVLGRTDGEHEPYQQTPVKLPLKLQDHNHPVRYRNIWIREIPETQGGHA
jgi:3-keto-disaccharide hydrolase